MTARIADLAEQTGRDRDRVVDLVRGVSLLVVALGHWLLAAVWVDGDGALHAGHLLETSPWTRWLTWGAQVMALFFIAGAFANATSWRGHVAAGGSYGAWLVGRARRLLGPTVPFVVGWTVLAVGAAVHGGVPEDLLGTVGQLVAVPLWFLAVFFLVVAAAPAMLALHDRHRLRALAGLLAAAIIVEVASRGLGVPLVGWLQFALVWGAVHQVGFFWQDGSLRRAGRRVWTAMVLGGGGGLWLSTVVLDWYPVSMVGVPGDVRSNNSPPSLALVLLGVAHLGLVMLAHGRLTALLDRPRVWRVTVGLGAISMSSYLTHLTGMVVVLAAVAASPLDGVLLGAEPGTASWWAARPLWLAAYAVATAPLILWFVRYERGAVTRAAAVRRLEARSAPAVAGSLAVCAAMGLLVASGFHAASMPAGLPVPALAALATGLVLLRTASRTVGDLPAPARPQRVRP